MYCRNGVTEKFNSFKTLIFLNRGKHRNPLSSHAKTPAKKIPMTMSRIRSIVEKWSNVNVCETELGRDVVAIHFLFIFESSKIERPFAQVSWGLTCAAPLGVNLAACLCVLPLFTDLTWQHESGCLYFRHTHKRSLRRPNVTLLLFLFSAKPTPISRAILAVASWREQLLTALTEGLMGGGIAAAAA